MSQLPRKMRGSSALLDQCGEVSHAGRCHFVQDLILCGEMSNAGRCHFLVLRGGVTRGKDKWGGVTRGGTIAPKSFVTLAPGGRN